MTLLKQVNHGTRSLREPLPLPQNIEITMNQSNHDFNSLSGQIECD
jgi:hypothetical protein